jgi:uncharacterized protein
MTNPTTALITGASTGIGATYAERLARRGHDLVLVARDAKRLEALAHRLREETNVAVDVLQADLTDARQLELVEARVRSDAKIGILVNNAGAAAHGGFEGVDVSEATMLIDLNITALTRLTLAALPRFLEKGEGAVINLASVVGIIPELQLGNYGATKAYVIAFTQALQAELGGRGIRFQAVMPAATRTEIWERAGRDVDALSDVMEVGELVDASLAGFDKGEVITIPPLPDDAQWNAYEAARQAMLPNLQRAHAAERYAKLAA